jgi:hypothetical protein
MSNQRHVELAAYADPWDDAAEVSAHGVQAEALDVALLGDDQVGGVALQHGGRGYHQSRSTRDNSSIASPKHTSDAKYDHRLCEQHAASIVTPVLEVL